MAIAIVAVVFLFLYLGVKMVPQGYNWTVERFGRYRVTLRPGLNIILPFVDLIGRKVNVQEQVLDIPSQNVITKDNATVTVDGVVFYLVMTPELAAYQVADLNAAIINLALTNIRTAIGAMDLDEVLSRRDEINARLLTVLDSATNPWGTKITRVELKDVRPPEDVVTSMAKQLNADREKRARILEAEGIRQSEILKAEGEKQAMILAAEGRLEASKRDAEARERLAEAEATATRLVSEAARGGNAVALNYFIAQKYTEALQTIGGAENAKLVVLPVEASALAGSVAGIGSLIRDALGPDAPKPAGPWTR
ncbi:MAG: SPFH/Band 7/PHB domain protein [Alphaproteobacteria bacterium]|nr:SPFH/Band 7/PHB domain protein [Alphaproteobacteria bacterium]